MFKIKGLYNTAIVNQTKKNVEQSCIDQIKELMNKPFVEGENIAIMPDCHTGKSVCIGYTQTLKNKKVCPNLVGVDIGCGVQATYINRMFYLFNYKNTLYEEDFKLIDEIIRKYIPVGFSVHNREDIEEYINKYDVENLLNGLKCWNSFTDEIKNHILCSVGTLGGGNHFIEIDRFNGGYYLIVHTGSRNLGVQVCSYYQNVAYTKQGGDKEYCYLENEDFNNYINDMAICQQFANINREVIREIIITKYLQANNINSNDYIIPFYKDRLSIHNYIDVDNMIIRKGAISAREDEKVIIPLNMKDGCVFGIGKGNTEMNLSAPHGAGRKLSRTEAKEELDMEDFERSMKGIYSTCINENTIDESPMAYKDTNEVLDFIKKSVKIEEISDCVYNFKAN